MYGFLLLHEPLVATVVLCWSRANAGAAFLSHSFQLIPSSVLTRVNESTRVDWQQARKTATIFKNAVEQGQEESNLLSNQQTAGCSLFRLFCCFPFSLRKRLIYSQECVPDPTQYKYIVVRIQGMLWFPSAWPVCGLAHCADFWVQADELQGISHMDHDV